MQTLAELSETLATWTKFVFFHVLPIAVAQIYDWLRDWQLLVVAVLVLVVFHVWSRGVLRAARRTARETVLSEAKSFDASLRLMRRQIEQLQDSLTQRQPTAVPAATQPIPHDHDRPSPPPPELPIAEARSARPQTDRTIDGLRQAIRHALGAIPLTDDPLTEDGARLYGNVITYLKDSPAPERGEGSPLARLYHELTELERATPPATCRQAWQSLVSVNALARDLAKTDGDASGSHGLLTMPDRATG